MTMKAQPSEHVRQWVLRRMREFRTLEEFRSWWSGSLSPLYQRDPEILAEKERLKEMLK